MQLWEEKIYIREEGKQEGKREGEILKIIKMVQRKIKKGKSLEVTADELEEAAEVIEPIYILVKKRPDADPEEIYKNLVS